MEFTENELSEFLGVAGAQGAEEPAPAGEEAAAAGGNDASQAAGRQPEQSQSAGRLTEQSLPPQAAMTRDGHDASQAGGDEDIMDPGDGIPLAKNEVPEPAQEAETGDPVKGESEQSQAAIQAAVKAALAARDAEHRKALEELEARQKRQLADFFQTAQLKNTISNAPITSMEEFEAWRRDYQAQQLQKNLQEGKLTREDLDAMIAGNPAVKAAQEAARQQQEAERTAREAQERTAFQAQVDREIAEIGKLDPSVKSVEDLLRKPNAQQFQEYVRRGNTFLDAYYLANREELAARREETARKAAQAAALEARSRDHLRSTGSVGSGAAAVPRDVMELYREMLPNASEADIIAHYNKTLAETGGK